MTSLPADLPTNFNELPDYDTIKSAYGKCLLAQDYYENQPTRANTRLALICVRVVGYTLYHAPSETGMAAILREISSCRDQAALCDLGNVYLKALTRAAECRTPPPSDHASRPSLDTMANVINDGTLDLAPQSHTSAKRSALARDGFRCMVTKKYDMDSAESILELRELDLDWEATSLTQCAHIFGESANYGIAPGSDKRDWATSMWAVMSRFGYTTPPDELNGANIHRLENILTLDVCVYRLFDSLGFWFVATDLERWENRKHIYKIEVHKHPVGEMLKRAYPTVTFESTRDDLPLPSPEYLAIHAACCKIRHLSGALAWFREFEDDLDKHLHKTLANDGTSAEFLYNVLCVHALIADTIEAAV